MIKMLKVYFIEYRETIKFFGDNGNTLEIEKNERTYPLIKKLQKNNKIILKNLLTR